MRLPGILIIVVAALAFAPAAASAAGAGGDPVVPRVDYPGIQHLHYEFGPVAITPGQNTIEVRPNALKPKVPGFITRFKPDLVYADTHKVPRVDVIHLHHGVWLVNLQPTFAAGEEKTIFQAPQGFGYHYEPSDKWDMNYMIHNLTPNPSSVYITYDIDFVPESEPAAQGLTRVKPLWLDVAGIRAYPVFDARRGWGRKGRYTFPDQARGAQRQAIGPAHEWTAPGDVTFVGTAGHLHPGGLHTDLDITRGTSRRRLFRSVAKYYEPAGAVSWDVAMTATKPAWRIAVDKGDTVDVSATYDTRHASWYESMGIMVVFYAEGHVGGAQDPFTQQPDWHGVPTHGHLPENDNHGGGALGLPDARRLLTGAPTGSVTIKSFLYGRGDLNQTGPLRRPPAVRQGRSLRFTNLDARASMDPAVAAYHTITGCRAPCNRATGIAYPLADGASFDSGELGYGPRFFTAAAQRNTWSTPKGLRPGTYTYFCRIHPFMRGAFRVVGGRSRGA
jgi:hypothetical protein